MQMKNKILASITALCAALVLVGGFSVTAYAQTPTEETDDSGVIVETEPQPLTPEGNMTLVDDIDGDAAEDKQFIVVKSKGGNYFYIIVDRAAEGENSVHFLNQVDESDLMAIIGEEQTEQPPAVCNCTEKCKAGEVNTACPVCSAAMNNCTGKEAEPEAPAISFGTRLSRLSHSFRCRLPCVSQAPSSSRAFFPSRESDSIM